MAKVTMATVKAFVRKNKGRIYVRNLSDFNAMTDCVERSADREFYLAEVEEDSMHTLGVKGAWFVLSSRDRMMPIESDEFVGFHVYNSCGSFDLAVKK